MMRNVPSLSTGLAYGSALDALFKDFALEDAFYVDAGSVNHVGLKLSGFDQVLDLGDGDLGGGGHHGVEVAGGLAVHEIAPAVSLPGLDESEVGGESALHEVGAAIELAGFFVFGDHGADAG